MSLRFCGRVAVVAALSVVASLAGMTPVEADDGTTTIDAQASTPTTEAEASASAASSGQRVEVVSEATETTQLFANPDGTFTLESSARPTRVRKSGSWIPVDTRLVRNADGSLSPRAATADVTLSPGGDGPLLTMSRNGSTMSWTWGHPLPSPTVEGDTAVYADVLTDVDLRVTAQPEGFSEVLVVKTPQGAAAEEIARPSFGLKVDGGRVERTDDGGFRVLNDDGELALSAIAPKMWDSAGSIAPAPSPTSADVGAVRRRASVEQDGDPATTTAADDPAARLQGPQPGDHVRDVGMNLASGSLDLVPDQGMLADPSTVYPVIVDPATATSSRNAWAMVDKSFPGTSYYKWSGDQGVGYQNYEPSSTKRLFFKMPLKQVAGTDIISATFTVTENFAASCTPEPVDLWRTGAFDSSTTWKDQPSWSAKIDTATVSYGRANCSKGKNVSPDQLGVEFDATPGVKTIAKANSAYGYFGLRAPSESNELEWKRFRSDAKLSVVYDHAPLKPTGLKGPGGCAGASAPAPVPSERVTLTSSLKDPDSGDLLSAYYTVYDAANKIVAHPEIPARTQKQPFTTPSFSVPKPAVGSTLTYHWTVYSSDGRDKSPTAGPCYFTVDLTAPAPPDVTLDVAGVATPPPGDGEDARPVTVLSDLKFTFAPGQGSEKDTVKYRWSINDDTPNKQWLPSSTASVGGVTQTPTLRVTSSGPNIVRVWAYDKAGNQSGPTIYELAASGFQPARWSLDSASSPSAPDPACTPSGSGPAPSGLVWSGGVTSGPGHEALAVRTDKALHLGGKGLAATADDAPTANAPLGTTLPQEENYTVSAWVKVDPSVLNETVKSAPLLVGGSRTAFSLDGDTGSALTVDIRPDPGVDDPDAKGAARFTATLAGSGKDAPLAMDTTTEISSTSWYWVAVSVDVADGQVQLIVAEDDGGLLLSTRAVEDTWTSAFTPSEVTGSLRVGSTKPTSGSAPVAAWVGDVDEVLAFRGAFVGDGQISDELRYWQFKTPPFSSDPGNPKQSPCT